MSKISDELRNWCESEDGTECGGFVTKASFNKILAIADRIDAEPDTVFAGSLWASM